VRKNSWKFNVKTVFYYMFSFTRPKHSACSESVGGPSGAARGRQQQFRRAHDDCRKSLRHRRRSTGGPSDRSTTLQRPQNAARHVLPSAAYHSAFRTVSNILVTTSGELILLPVGGRHPKLNVGRRQLTRYSDFDIPPSFLRSFSAFRTFRDQNGG